METINTCVICGSNQFEPFLVCKDYTVSKEQFSIMSCSKCQFKFTNPRPYPNELGKYYQSEEYISHSNTQKGIVSKLYHLVRNHTLKQKLNIIKGFFKTGSILDYGSGTGMFLKVCQDNGWQTKGVEPDDKARSFSITENKIDVVSSIEELNKETKYQVITLWHVLEHVPNLHETLQAFHNQLVDGGVLLIAVPNCHSHDAKYYKEHWAAYDVPRHLYHFTQNDMVSLLNMFKFTFIKSLPMKFDSFYVSMLSEKYKHGTINYIGAFWRGLISNWKAKNNQEYSSKIYIFKK